MIQIITVPKTPVAESKVLNEIPITRAYVRTESGAEHTLVYYIFAHAPQNKATTYGVTIKQQDTDARFTDSVSILVSEDKDEVVGIIDCFAKNFVFPCSLSDLLADMGQADIIF